MMAFILIIFKTNDISFIFIYIYTSARVTYLFRGVGETNQKYALLMVAKKLETALFRTHFSLFLHWWISSCIEEVYVIKYKLQSTVKAGCYAHFVVKRISTVKGMVLTRPTFRY